jgi:hypothetical protein
MRFSLKRSRALRLAWLALVAVAGCGPDLSTNRSPTPDQDPDRYQRAVHQSTGKARKDQEDERKAFQSKGQINPNH